MLLISDHDTCIDTTPYGRHLYRDYCDQHSVILMIADSNNVWGDPVCRFVPGEAQQKRWIMDYSTYARSRIGHHKQLAEDILPAHRMNV